MGLGWGGPSPGPVAPWSGAVGIHVSLGAGLGNQALPSHLEGGLYPGPLPPPSPLSPSAPHPGARLSRPVFQRLAPPPRGSHTWGAAWQLAAKQATSLLPSGQSFLLPLPPLPAREQQTNKQASSQALQAQLTPAAVGVGSSAALPRGHGQPAAGDPPTLPSALHPLQAAASEKPLCLLLQYETLQCPRLAKWRWGNCRNPRVTSPSWLQTPVSFPEENSGRLPSGGQALGLLDAEVGTLT